MEKAYLILETGEIFEGKGFGAVSESIGELVFHTGVVGYVDTLTDPNYCGQTLMFTFPQLGNYGIVPIESDTKCYVKGVVAHNWCDQPSNFRCMGTIDEFLKQQGVPGIYGVDTRRLTQIVRDHGVMNAIIANKVPENMLSDLHNYKVTGAVEATSIVEPAFFIPEGKPAYHVAVISYGGKADAVVSALTARGCKVTVLPYRTTAEDVLALSPNGVVLTEGPGNPADYADCAKEVQKLLGKLPMFGLGLGHQLMAMAVGAKTAKLKFGHHGGNQPVKNLMTGRSYVTAQNHNYYVDAASVEGTAAQVSYVSLNDGSAEGLEYPGMNAFSLQFTPAYTGSLRDMENIYDRFVSMMGGKH